MFHPDGFLFLSVTNITKLERLHRAASRAITGCLSSSHIPFLLSENSLPLLRVTLINFALSCYERAFRFPTFFPISGLARHGVKPRLCKSSWRAFTCTHPLMLPSTSLRDALLVCTPFPPWNLPSFTVESTLSFPCSCSDPLFLAKVKLSLTFVLSHLTTWCSGQTALFLLAKAALAYFSSALSVALRPLFPFQQTQYAQVFRLQPAPLSKLFAGLGSINKSATFLLFYMTLVLSSSPCSLLRLSCYFNLSGRNCLFSPPVLSAYNGPSDICFFRETMQLMSWPDGERYSCPLQFFVVFSSHLLYPLITFLGLKAYCLIEILQHTGSLGFHRGACAPSSRLLCAFSSSLQRTKPTVKLLSLYDWQNRESFLQHLQTLVPGHHSSHSALSSYGLFAPLALWRLSVSLRPLVQALESFLVSSAPCHSPCPHPSEGVGYQQHQTKIELTNAPFALCLAQCGLLSI